MEPNPHSLDDHFTKEIPTDIINHLDAKYLTLVIKAVHDAHYSKLLPENRNTKAKSKKIANELVIRFLEKYGMQFTLTSFNAELKRINREDNSSLMNMIKLPEQTENPLHELLNIMKNTKRLQFHHPKLVQALLIKVPNLLNEATRSHFDKIMSKGQNNTNSTPTKVLNGSAINGNNSFDTKISPIQKKVDDVNNTSLHDNIDEIDAIRSPNEQTKEREIALNETPPKVSPTKINRTGVLHSDGSGYQNLSSTNGTHAEEEEINDSQQETNKTDTKEENDDDYDYEYQYEEVMNNEDKQKENEEKPDDQMPIEIPVSQKVNHENEVKRDDQIPIENLKSQKVQQKPKPTTINQPQSQFQKSPSKNTSSEHVSQIGTDSSISFIRNNSDIFDDVFSTSQNRIEEEEINEKSENQMSTSTAGIDNENGQKRQLDQVSNAIQKLLTFQKAIPANDDQSSVCIPLSDDQISIESSSVENPRFQNQFETLGQLIHASYKPNSNLSHETTSDLSYETKSDLTDKSKSNYSYETRSTLTESVTRSNIDDELSYPSYYSNTYNESDIPTTNEIQQQPEPIVEPTNQQLSSASKESPKQLPSPIEKPKSKSDYDSVTSYYSETGSTRVKPIKFKISKKQFLKLYPEGTKNPTLIASRKGYDALQAMLKNQKQPTPIKAKLSPTKPTSQSNFSSPKKSTPPKKPSKEKQDDESTVTFVTKGPHAGMIKRKIKKSEHQADIERKLQKKTEIAKKLQEELRAQQKEIKKQKRELERQNEEEVINTSSVLSSPISVDSHINARAMSPRQRREKRKEIQEKLQHLQEKLEQPQHKENPPMTKEERRRQRAKIEAQLIKLREEYNQPTSCEYDSIEREEINPKSMSKTQKREMRHQIEDELQRLHEQLEMPTSQLGSISTSIGDSPPPKPRPKRINQPEPKKELSHSSKKDASYSNEFTDENDTYNNTQSNYSNHISSSNKDEMEKLSPIPDNNFSPIQNRIINESSSLSERRKLPQLTVMIPLEDRRSGPLEEYTKDVRDKGIKNENNNDGPKQPVYKPQQIYVKKDQYKVRRKQKVAKERKKEEDENQEIVIKDGKKKIKRRIQIPIKKEESEPKKKESSSNAKSEESIQSFINDNNQYVEKASLKDFLGGVSSSDSENNNKEELELLSDDYSSNLPSNNFLVTIKVVEADNVPHIDQFDDCDPYCMLFLENQGPKNGQRTKSMEKTSKPVWNETFDFVVKESKHSKTNSSLLVIQLKDEDVAAGDEILSSTKIDLYQFPLNRTVDQWFTLRSEVAPDGYTSKDEQLNSQNRKNGGRVHLVLKKVVLLEDDNNDDNISYSNSRPSTKSDNRVNKFESSPKLRLCISIDQAKGLVKRNQYVIAKIKNSHEGLAKTRPLNSSEPAWHESFKLRLPNPATDVLMITLRVRDPNNGDDDIGYLSIPLSKVLSPGEITDKWFDMRPTSISRLASPINKEEMISQTLCGSIHLIMFTENDNDDTEYHSNSKADEIITSPNLDRTHLALKVIEARGLPSRCSPYCVVQILGEKPILQTRAVEPSHPIKWNQKMEFTTQKASNGGTLKISIKDKRSINSQELATFEIPVDTYGDAEINESIDQWYQLKPSGEIHLQLIPKMKDTVKAISVSSRKSNNEKSNEEEMEILIDASSVEDISDIDSDKRSAKKKRTPRKGKKGKRKIISPEIE